MARLLQINACDRATGIPSNCTFKLDRPIGGRYRLAGVQVPYVQPPLYVDGTRCLAYQVDGVWKSAVLEGPIYTPQQLLPILKDALDIFSNSGDDPFIEFTVELDAFNRLKYLEPRML